MRPEGRKKETALKGPNVLGRALLISAAVHFVAVMMVTVTAVPVPSTPEFVDISMVTVDDTWSNPAVDPDPTPAAKAISYAQIGRMTAAPRLELYQNKYQWEDDIGQLISATSEITRYDFMKEESDYEFIFDNLKRGLLSRNGLDTMMVKEVDRPQSGIRLSGGLDGRTILNYAELDRRLQKISASMSQTVRMRIGVDGEGNVRHLLPDGSNKSDPSMAAAARLALSMRFKPDKVDTGTVWGSVEIRPRQRDETKPAGKPDKVTEKPI
jgi:hypothetical protein